MACTYIQTLQSIVCSYRSLFTTYIISRIAYAAMIMVRLLHINIALLMHYLIVTIQ